MKTRVVRKGDVYGLDDVAKLIRGLAIDNARNKFSAVDITKQTDSTTGTAAAAIAAVTLPAATHLTDGVATTAAPKAGFDTAIGKLANCAASFANHINYYLASLGHPQIVIPSGPTVTAALPALDKTLSGVATTGAVEPDTGRTQLQRQIDNLSTIARGCNKIAEALGIPTLADVSGGAASNTLYAAASTGSSVNGSTTATLSDTQVDAALTAIANNYASLALFIGRVIDPDEATNLTDSSGGTASSAIPPALAALTIPSAYTTAGTDCAPKAGFDTALGVIENNLAELTAKANDLIRYRGLTERGITLLTDSTGQTTNGTLESQSVNLTAVTGTTACVDFTTAAASLLAVKNNISTIAAKVNDISEFYGLIDLADSTGGTVSTSGTVANVASTGTGNDGTADATMSDTDVDAVLVVIRNSLSTIAARLNALDDIGSQQSLTVVAGY